MKTDLFRLLPEIYQLLLVLGLFVQTCAGREHQRQAGWVPAAAGFGLLVGLTSVVLPAGAGHEYFWGAYRVDGLSQFFKLAISMGFFVAVLNGWRKGTLDDDKRADYLFFLAFSAWGLMLLASSVELVTAYVALEVSSYSLFAVVPLRAKERSAAEAGIKYVITSYSIHYTKLYD